jgi:molybdopterin-guanine dinucleotide biosynthesis protein A
MDQDMPATPFSALLLAGGASTRMGRDKALLPHPISGRSLLEHQATLLRSLPGCAELLISAPPERAYRCSGELATAQLVEDSLPGLGPLGGVAAGLARASQRRLLVLAVDLPWVTPRLLERLLDPAGSGAPATTELRGSVPRHADGRFEPLCAVYPQAPEPRRAIEDALLWGRLSLQDLLHTACAAGWMQPLAIDESELRCFTNWNTPSDLPP